MQRLFLLLLSIWLLKSTNAQTIAENKVDDFTHRRIKQTSWDLLVYKFDGSMYAHTRISRVDSSLFLVVRYLCRGACVMAQGAKLLIKLSDDSVVMLENTQMVAGCPGCGSVGIVGSDKLGMEMFFVLSDAQLKELAQSPVAKVRFYLAEGYEEASVGKGNGKNLQRQALLMKE